MIEGNHFFGFGQNRIRNTIGFAKPKLTVQHIQKLLLTPFDLFRKFKLAIQHSNYLIGAEVIGYMAMTSVTSVTGSESSEAELRLRLDQSEAAYLGAESEKERRRRH